MVLARRQCRVRDPRLPGSLRLAPSPLRAARPDQGIPAVVEWMRVLHPGHLDSPLASGSCARRSSSRSLAATGAAAAATASVFGYGPEVAGAILCLRRRASRAPARPLAQPGERVLPGGRAAARRGLHHRAGDQPDSCSLGRCRRSAYRGSVRRKGSRAWPSPTPAPAEPADGYLRGPGCSVPDPGLEQHRVYGRGVLSVGWPPGNHALAAWHLMAIAERLPDSSRVAGSVPAARCSGERTGRLGRRAHPLPGLHADRHHPALFHGLKADRAHRNAFRRGPVGAQ